MTENIICNVPFASLSCSFLHFSFQSIDELRHHNSQVQRKKKLHYFGATIQISKLIWSTSTLFKFGIQYTITNSLKGRMQQIILNSMNTFLENPVPSMYAKNKSKNIHSRTSQFLVDMIINQKCEIFYHFSLKTSILAKA